VIRHQDTSGQTCAYLKFVAHDLTFSMRVARTCAAVEISKALPVCHGRLFEVLLVDKLIEAAKVNRLGHCDATMILVCYRHGFRPSELVDLRWSQVDFDSHRLHVRRAKKGNPATHPLQGDETRALRKLRRVRVSLDSTTSRATWDGAQRVVASSTALELVAASWRCLRLRRARDQRRGDGDRRSRTVSHLSASPIWYTPRSTYLIRPCFFST
jgi:integrase